MGDKIYNFIGDLVVVIVMSFPILIVGLVFVLLPCMQYGVSDGEYQIQFPNMSSEQCQYATTNVRDISFLEVTSKIDPCTLKTVYYYCYRVTWKTDAKGWLVAYLEKDGIEPIKIETYEGSK